MNSKQYLEKTKKEYAVREGNKKQLETNINDLNLVTEKEEALVLELSQVLTLLNTTSINAREKAKNHLENLVTSALQFIHEDYCEFKIELTQQRGVASAEFFVVTEVNGEVSKQKPQDACGGGYVDVIATTLRYAYMKAYNNPRINNAIFLDEPGKCVSEIASIKFAEFIKKMGELFDTQTIMITHNENLKAIANKSIIVSKNGTKSYVVYGEGESNEV